MTKTILFISHRKAQCGVYEFGKSITDVLQLSKKYKFIRTECSSLSELNAAIATHAPSAIIYNYYPSVLPWLATHVGRKLWKNNIASIHIPQIGIIHEITQEVADTASNYKSKYVFGNASHLSNSLFDFYVTPDPTLLLRNPFVYKTGRLIPKYQNKFVLSSRPTIGSFGFATPLKGFEKIVQIVQQEFDEADIRFNIPAADFGEDKDGAKARALAEKCRALIVKPGIRLIVTHDFLDAMAMLDFLANNTVNMFLYEHNATSGKGISSAVDNAMAVQRAIVVSDAVMFRHILDVDPSICITKNKLKAIIQNGFAPLEKHYDEWNAENLLWEYERIMDAVFLKQKDKPLRRRGMIRTLRFQVKTLLNKPEKSFTWLRDSKNVSEDDMRVDRSVRYLPINVPGNASLNRILDDSARKLYRPAIDKITELVPKTMAKKIARANVQQAFVFDTVYGFLSQYNNPKVLCVGSYEDTAAMSLVKMGFRIEEIDPTHNYYLQEYFTKPSTIKNSYDIVFSTSVIEHDPDDESFVRCLAGLLANGGVAVLTCDYKDGWKPSDPKPDCDARLYTQHDLRNRLLPLMSKCSLVDEPQWDCPNPDFNYLGKYQYTFAALVVRKEPQTKAAH